MTLNVLHVKSCTVNIKGSFVTAYNNVIRLVI